MPLAGAVVRERSAHANTLDISQGAARVAGGSISRTRGRLCVWITMTSLSYTKVIPVPHQSEKLVCVFVCVVMGKWKGLYCDLDLGGSTDFPERRTRGTKALTTV